MKQKIGFVKPNKFVIKLSGTYLLTFDTGPLLVNGSVTCSQPPDGVLTLNLYEGCVIEFPNAKQATVALDYNGETVYKLDDQSKDLP